VLTGDKVETAINIGFSCRLLGPEMIIIKVNTVPYELLMVAIHYLWRLFTSYGSYSLSMAAIN
jgi:magnesium-transporting ATPase (P-type)